MFFENVLEYMGGRVCVIETECVLVRDIDGVRMGVFESECVFESACVFESECVRGEESDLCTAMNCF